MWMVQAYDLVAQEYRSYEFRAREDAQDCRQELQKTTWAHNISMQYWN